MSKQDCSNRLRQIDATAAFSRWPLPSTLEPIKPFLGLTARGLWPALPNFGPSPRGRRQASGLLEALIGE
jgi:hypothetical protein